ncbi:MAG: T9SS type A sorting domain-containing protein [Bacteroidota bacterium]
MRFFYIIGLLIICTISSAFSQKHPDLIWSKSNEVHRQFSPDGKYFFAQIDRTIVKTDINNDNIIESIYTLPSDVASNWGFRISPDSKWLVILDNTNNLQSLRLISLVDKQIKYTSGQTYVSLVSFSSDAQNLAFYGIDSGRIYHVYNLDIATNNITWRQQLKKNIARFQHINSTNNVYTYDISGNGNIWDGKTGQLVEKVDLREYFPDGKLYIAYNRSFEDRWAVSSLRGDIVTTIPQINIHTFSPHGRYMLFSEPDTVQKKDIVTLYDIITVEEVNRYEYPLYSYPSPSFSPDSQYVIIKTENKMDLYRFNTATSVEETNPQTFNLSATPNPASAQSLITFTLLKESPVTLSVFDAAGREVLKLLSGQGSFGENRFQWNTEKLPQGTYFIRLEADGKSAQVQCAVVR